jgi:hypothetical protein
VVGLDLEHEEFGLLGPGRAVVQAVGQVGTDDGQDGDGQASHGQAWYRRPASRTTIEAAQIKRSTVNGSRWAVRPVSPWVVTNS